MRHALLALVLCLHALSARAAAPIPFTDPYQDGYVWVIWGTEYTDAELDVMLERLKQTGAKHVQVPIWGCQTDLTSSDVGACELRSKEYMFRQVDRAIAHGFNTKILPIMGTKDWKWRGYFVPTDVDQWFENYTKWIVDLAREARIRGLKEFVAGSEFNGLYVHEDRWRKVVAEVRREFQGPVILTTNWDNVAHKFWDSVDAIGISAYFPLSKQLDPPQAELDAAWLAKKKELLRISKSFKRPLHFTEVGYTNTDSAAKSPWAPSENGKVNDALQARCFEAFRKAWSGEKTLVRANVWSYGHAESHPGINGDPVGRPAEAILKAFFEGRERTLRWFWAGLQ